ncbi:MAG: tetratricopeptide repeat protein [Candidatus Wallbacteria bacterium]|nr:tetratricopeptide repeat protein [Candidatus Wallbacteria bacterium]
MPDTSREEFAAAVSRPEEEIDLAEASLLIARMEYPGLDVRSYLARLDGMADAIRARLPRGSRAGRITREMNRYLFEECGLRGNEQDYYNPCNSFLNDVLDRKLGIPITLAIVYMEIGRRLGVRLDGISFPGHFLVKLRQADGDWILDPFHQGAVLDEDTLQKQVDEALTPGLVPEEQSQKWLVTADKREILARLLRNLKAIYLHGGDVERALNAVDRILLVTPDAPGELRDRGLLYDKMQHRRAALADYARYLELVPDAEDAAEIRERVAVLRETIETIN